MISSVRPEGLLSHMFHKDRSTVRSGPYLLSASVLGGGTISQREPISSVANLPEGQITDTLHLNLNYSKSLNSLN